MHTHSLGETKALFYLNAGVWRLSAYVQKTRRHARKVNVVARPLFPRYLFVALDMSTDRWWSVQSTVGVSHLVCHGEHVLGGMIDALRRREDVDGYCTMSELDAFKEGPADEISDGPFSDFTRIFDKVSDTERVYILLNLMSHEVRVRVPIQAVKIST